MPDKPVKYDIKLFMLCDSTNGHCKQFDVYVGNDERNVGNIGKTGKAVLNVLRGLEQSHHHVYMDNFYTSPIPFLTMKNMALYACGTARNRKGYPMNELKAMPTREGEAKLLGLAGTTLCWQLSGKTERRSIR